MDSITLDIHPANASCGLMGDVVHIAINDRKLIDILGEAELGLAMIDGHSEVAGFYRGLEPGAFLSQLNRQYAKIIVLERQGFHSTEFWPLSVKVTELDDLVVWDEFEQSHGGENVWKFEGLRFVFDRRKYELEMLTIIALGAISWGNDL